ncbi:BTAD domain-containing putative transcriptional regulator [Nocardia brasiliensis]|uniref:BTAD domain-containing putative transcriptional regulator n=1 Tax=Nocardia brasiliensis TaxID=37326 RepID=UPI0033E696D9
MTQSHRGDIPNPAPEPRDSQAPMMVAVAGLGPRVGTTTTTLALARTWPGPEPSLVVEADPVGGHLAEVGGGDPYLGLASLARTITADEPIEPDRLADHVQFLPDGVALLAAPPGRAGYPMVSAASLLVGPHASWRSLGATVFADCGAPEPDSVLAPVLADADACLVVVQADRSDPELVVRRIHTLTRHSRSRGVVLIGANAHSEFAAALALPLLGTLPRARKSAEALLAGSAGPRRRPHLLPAARIIARAVHHQLRPPTHTRNPGQPPTPPSARAPRRNEEDGTPRVYLLDPIPAVSPHPPPPQTPESEPLAAIEMPAGAEPALAELAEDAGRFGESVLAPLPEPPPDPGSLADLALAHLTQPDTPALMVRVFGPTRILWRAPETGETTEITSRLQPRSREVLAVLALHPNGVSRPRVIDMLWGERPPARATSALTNTLSRLRTAVTAATGGRITELLTDDRLHYRLSEATINVDYWDFNAAVAARRRASSDADHAATCRTIADLATAELAPDLTGTWAEPLRESARRDALNALSWLATRNAESDPRATLGLLETTAENDPYNEIVWQDILRLHARLGEYAALDRTYSLLTRKLAEIGQTPSQETRHLLQQLRHATK